MNKTIKRGAVIFFLFTMLVVTSSVFAGDDSPPPESILLSQATEREGAEVSIPNPYGCVGWTDNPHKSTHVPGNVNVVEKTECPAGVPKIYVETRLQKQSCFIVCWWSNVGSLGSQLKTFSHKVSTSSAATCASGKYRGVSYHYIIGWDDISYDADSVSQEVNIIC